jgi:hypothetical protein
VASRPLPAGPEIIVKTWRTARVQLPDLTEAEVRDALHEFNAVWYELFPSEQARIVRDLVERVDVHERGISICLRTEGLTSLLRDLRPAARAAA